MDGGDQVAIRDTEAGAILAVKVVAGSSGDRIAGVLGDCLKIATSAPAEKDKANAAVARILADALALDRKAVRLACGRTSSRKEFLLAGLSARQVRMRIEAL